MDLESLQQRADGARELQEQVRRAGERTERLRALLSGRWLHAPWETDESAAARTLPLYVFLATPLAFLYRLLAYARLRRLLCKAPVDLCAAALVPLLHGHEDTALLAESLLRKVVPRERTDLLPCEPPRGPANEVSPADED